MASKKSFGKLLALALVLSIVSLFSAGCDSGLEVCTDGVSGVARTSGTKLYYPCNISAPTGATTMTSGFTGTLSAVEWLSNDIAGAGFVVLAFTPANVMGMVEQWRSAHKNCIAKLKELNSTHAVLRGNIDTGKLSTCGHSKGGGGSLWAASELRNQLKTAVGMAPWMEGFTTATLRSITAATLVQAGSADTLAMGAMTRSEYNGVGSRQKCYVTYNGYGHMAWAMTTGTRARTLSGDIIAWMNYYMNGEGRPPARCSGSSSSGGCN